MKDGRELRSEECASSSAGENARKEKAVSSVTRSTLEKVMEQTGRANIKRDSTHGNLVIGSARHAEIISSARMSTVRCASGEEFSHSDHFKIPLERSQRHQRSNVG